jgi:hypothetical protein
VKANLRCNFISSDQKLAKKHRLALIIIILLSIPVKLFYLKYNQAAIGPDAIEYLAAAKIFEINKLAYFLSRDPYTLWRMP